MALINFKGFQLATGTRQKLKNSLKRKQTVIDSEVLRLCVPLIPEQTGALINSGHAHGGSVTYDAPYAHDQYYNTKTSRPYDGNRGAKWFERMKTTSKKQILKKAEEA